VEQAPKTTAFASSWLCPTPLDRARLLDLDGRLGSSWTLIEQLFPLTVILAAWRVGPLALLPLVCVPMFAVLPKLLPRMRKPEWLLMGSLLTFIATITTASAFTGGVRSPLIYWVIFYLVGCAARFARRALAFATIVGLAGTIAAVVGADPARAWRDLPALVALLAVAVVAGRYTRVLTHAEFDYREAALVDELTGLLNRKALQARFEQERQQAAHAGGTICIVLCDLDRFKDVNDRHGHDRGDAVLRDAAVALRRALRSSGLIFRIGGEEFLLLLPGVDGADGAAAAERLRKVLATSRPGGLELTASFGVAAAHGHQIVFETLFHRADEALYAAKSAGRNRVSVANPDVPVAVAA
jgi:diguanylate cyclase (GGDEF)-like protein